jgi:hypothetical protein
MKPLAVMMLLLALTPPLPAQDNLQPDTQAGDFLFHLPPGWKRIDQDGKTLLVPANAGSSPATYIQLKGFDLGSYDLKAGFNAGWQGFTSGHKVVSSTPVVSQHSPNGFDYLYTTGIATEGGKQWAITFVGAQYGKRLETVLFKSSEAETHTHEGYLTEFQRFLNTVRFAPPGASPVSSPGDSESGKRARIK